MGVGWAMDLLPGIQILRAPRFNGGGPHGTFAGPRPGKSEPAIKEPRGDLELAVVDRDGGQEGYRVSATTPTR